MAASYDGKHDKGEVRIEIKSEPKTEDHWLKEWTETESDTKCFKLELDPGTCESKQIEVKTEQEHEVFKKGALDDPAVRRKDKETAKRSAAQLTLQNKRSKSDEGLKNQLKDAVVSNKVAGM